MSSSKLKKKIKSFIISAGSIGAFAAINYTLLHTPLVFLMAFVLFIHELGHYLVAKYHKAKVSYPIFLPLPLFSVGLTRIRDLSLSKVPVVALSGMLFSISFIIFLLINNYFLLLFPTSILFAILFSELFYNFIGFDGKKYRSAKQKLNAFA